MLFDAARGSFDRRGPGRDATIGGRRGMTLAAIRSPARDEAVAGPMPERPPTAPRGEGYAGRRRLGTRSASLLLTLAVYAAILVLLFVTFTHTRILKPSAQPLVVEMLPIAAPPEPVREIPEGPRRVEQQASKPKPKLPDPAITIPLQPTTPSAPAEPEQPAKAAVPVPATTAPKSMPAPPANRASSNAEHSWEAQILAHLERHRRYPIAARLRREQGVTIVRFRINRPGQVLSLSLTRSSGSRVLDGAAIDTIKRAQPLPHIPDDRPDELDLTVPVEFFVRPIMR
jgi:periplasmic protein TonB